MTLKSLLHLLPLVPSIVRGLPHEIADTTSIVQKDVAPIYKREGRAFREWTAMGDSYASGVGAGPQPKDDKNRCLRFPQAYPAVMQSGDGSLNPNPEIWNNVACSGNTFDQIMAKEFLDEP